MPRFAKHILIAAGAAVALAAAVLVFANLYLQSEAVQERVRRAASQALGGPVEIKGVFITPWTGLVVRAPRIPDPLEPGRAILEARELRAQAAFWPLLSGRLIFRSVELVEPVLAARQRPDKTWAAVVPPPPGRKLAVPVESPRTAPEPEPETPSPEPEPAASPEASPSSAARHFQVEVEKVGVRDAVIMVADSSGQVLLRAEKARVSAALYPDRSSKGIFEVEKLALGRTAFVRHLRGEFLWDGRTLAIEGAQGALAGGTLTLSLRLVPTTPGSFEAKLDVESAQLPVLLEEAGRDAEGAAGLLRGTFSAAGDPAVPATWSGGGEFQLEAAKFTPVEFLVQVGRLLAVEELQRLDLQEASLHLSLRDGSLLVEDLRMRSENLVLKAAGKVELDGRLDLNSALLVNRRLQKRLRPVMGPNFKDAAEEGYKQLDFRVFNTLARPQTDLLEKLAGQRVGREIGNFLRQILGPAPREEGRAGKE